MKRNSVPVASLPGADAPSGDKKKAERDAFLHDWIAFGMHLKNRADAHDVTWRGKSFETWMAEIVFAEEWAKPDQVME